MKSTLVYRVPSTTFAYTPGDGYVWQTYHPMNKTWRVKADSARGRYLIGLTATKGKLIQTKD